MSDDEPRRSRTAWPGPMSIAGVEPGHDHQLPAPLVQRIRLLTAAVVIFGVCLAAIATFLVLLIMERGKARDRENAELEREIRDSWCLSLDTLPEGGLLERLRGKYQCGPGIPIADLSPEERSQLSGGARAGVIPPSPVEVQPPTSRLGAPPTANPPRRPASEPPPRTAQPAEPAPEPSPEPGPLVGLEPLTEPVCGLMDGCL